MTTLAVAEPTHPIVSRLQAPDGAPLRMSGSGTWLDAGGRWQAAPVVSLRDHAGVVAYEPGDLVITVRAGTTLAELEAVTAAQGQWIGLDPPGSPEGTIGATIATASAGPLSHAVGTPRDLVLGMDLVTGYGARVQAGGRVVKNVAGFDLVRLYTGSWGTLGAILSVTLRLRARPVHDITCFLQRDDMATVHALRAPVFSLLAAEWLNAACAQRLGLPAAGVLVRIGGNGSLVDAQRDRLATLGRVDTLASTIWHQVARLDDEAPLVYRLSGHIAALGERHGAVPAGAVAHSSIGRGITRVIVPGSLPAALAPMPGVTRVVERAPAAVWAAEPDPFGTALARRVAAAFDPHARCNPRVQHG